MKVIICGAGQVGFNIARYLSAEEADVTVVDNNQELIQKVQDNLEVKGIVGHASHPDVLQEADAGSADMLVAVTYLDEVNMVACQVARALFNVPKRIARVRSRSYLSPTWSDLFTREHMPIDHIISPEIEVAKAIGRRMRIPGALDMIQLTGGLVSVIGVSCTAECPIINTPLRQLAALFPDLNISVVAIHRSGRHIVPSAHDQMLAGDEVYFVAETAHTDRALQAFGYQRREARRVVILGGGNIGLALAEDLESTGRNVNAKVIELEKARAQFVAQTLTRTVVLNGSCLDRTILEEASVSTAETAVAVTDDDKVNIMASLLAKQYGAQRAIALVNDSTYTPLVRSLGIDVMVNPRAVTISTILQHVRRGRIRAVHSIGDSLGEIIEAEALESSELVQGALKDINLPAGLIVAAVIRGAGARVIIPRGDTQIEPGDRVVIFATAEAVKRLEKILRVRPDFF